MTSEGLEPLALVSTSPLLTRYVPEVLFQIHLLVSYMLFYFHFLLLVVFGHFYLIVLTLLQSQSSTGPGGYQASSLVSGYQSLSDAPPPPPQQPSPSSYNIPPPTYPTGQSYGASAPSSYSSSYQSHDGTQSQSANIIS